MSFSLQVSPVLSEEKIKQVLMLMACMLQTGKGNGQKAILVKVCTLLTM